MLSTQNKKTQNIHFACPFHTKNVSTAIALIAGWVGLGWLGWVGLGWVGLGGLGWVGCVELGWLGWVWLGWGGWVGWGWVGWVGLCCVVLGKFLVCVCLCVCVCFFLQMNKAKCFHA